MTTDQAATTLPAPSPVILRDGVTAWLRPAREDDIDRLAALFGRGSRESLRWRFFTSRREVDRRYLEQSVRIDGENTMTFLVTRGEGDAEQAIAMGNYARVPGKDMAEVAFFVEDAAQGQGLGTLLLERLAAYAREQRIGTLAADVLADNSRMLEVFRTSGFRLKMSDDQGVVRVELPATADEAAIVRAEERERIATAASLVPFFRPRSVAVVGASRSPRSVGRMVMDRLIATGFEGPVYPVNPEARAVSSVRAYKSILDIPDEIDLAVIVVPAARVLPVVDQCAEKGVRALVVLSAGFAETGPDGRARQNELVHKARAHGMRVIGPNCMGILNTAPDVRLNATFSPTTPLRGRVAMSSQSGALGLAILSEAQELGLGLSMFVSVGNKADISGNDLLQYWETDPDTRLIVLYLESFGNPRKFTRIARRIGRHKPILAVKSGRTAAGSRAAQSHTAALAGSDRAVDALFRQAGVIRADTLQDMFDIATILANQPVPAGKRVAIVTNAGGPGILCADQTEAMGLELPAPAPETLERLRSFLPAAAGYNNPIDMIATAGPAQYERTVATMLRDPNVDALIVIYVPAGMASSEEIAAAIRRAVASVAEEQNGAHPPADKPVLTCFVSVSNTPPSLAAIGEGDTPATRQIPNYRFPEAPARALAHIARYAEWRNAPAGVVRTPEGVDVHAVRAVIESALESHGEGWLQPDEAAKLLAAAGIQTPAFRVARTPDEAATMAGEIGFPVAIKIVSATVTHKSDRGGVVLNLTSAEAVRQACETMAAQFADEGTLDGFLVQQMIEGGAEVITGVVDDGTFGPLVGFGLGGTAVEVLNDMAFRITPLTDRDTAEMVRSIRGLPLLQGYRGRPKADLAAVEDLLARISWLVEEETRIAEMEMNPVKVFEQGACVVDVRAYIRRR